MGGVRSLAAAQLCTAPISLPLQLQRPNPGRENMHQVLIMEDSWGHRSYTHSSSMP
jgi:hypothetical protein